MSRILTVIPTLNAARALPRALAGLEEGLTTGLLGRWTLSDGGSTDGTQALARRAGFTVVEGPPGRGGQLARGAEAALKRAGQDDWLLFLHADTRLQPGWSAEARRFIDNHQGRDRAAYFRFALDDAAPAARRLERFVALRCAALGLPYGDQGLLIEASFYRRLGGYRDMTLFEDVDIVRRIGRARLTGLRSKAVTSADRFRTEGYAKRSARNLALLARYYSGERPETLARAYAPPSSSPSPPRRTPA